MPIIGLVLSDGGATAVLDLTAGAVLYTAPVSTPFFSRGGADRFPTGLFGVFALFNAAAAKGPLTIWRWTGAGAFALVATVAAPSVTISSNSLANPTVVTTPAPHFLTSGQTVTIAGVLTSSPTINGTRVVTVLTPTTFTVPVNVTTGGTGGTLTAQSLGQWFAVSANGATLWTADSTGGLTVPVIRGLDQTGAILKTSGPLTAITNGVRALTPSLAEDILYYVNGLTTTPIKRWDLTNNVALSDLATPTGIVVGLWPVPGTTDLTIATRSASSAPVTFNLIRYTALGAVVSTTAFATLPAGATDTTIQLARDPSLTSIWARIPAAPAYLQTTASTYLNLNLLTGATISTVTIAATPAVGYFGLSPYGLPPAGTMYPFLVLGTSGAPSSGVVVPGGPSTPPCTSIT